MRIEVLVVLMYGRSEKKCLALELADTFAYASSTQDVMGHAINFFQGCITRQDS
jgi:hypothetical protein